MSRFLLFLWVFVALGLRAWSAPVKTEVRFQPLANLVYQLDAVSGLLPGDPQDYRALWAREFLKTPEDRAALDAWRGLRERYSRSLDIAEGGAYPLERPASSVSLFDKLRLASFQARSRKELLARLELVLGPADVAVADGILRRFETPFAVWWKREALAKGTPFAKKMSQLLAGRELRGQIERFRAFYDARQPEGSVCAFNLMYRPEAKSGSTSGQQVENYAIVEFLPGERPEDRMDVVIHELCHYFYGIGPATSVQKLQADFLRSSSPGSVPAFLLLNEGLATALGNGIVGRAFYGPEKFARLLKKPLSLYYNEGIDRAGKAALPLLDRWLAEGKTLYDPTFVETYVRTLETEFGSSLTAPRRYMAGLFLFVDEPLGASLTRQVRETLSVAGMYSSVGSMSDPRSFESYAANPNLSALVIVRPESVAEIGKALTLPESSVAALQAVVARDGEAVFGFSRGPHAVGVVLVAPDSARASALLLRLRDVSARFEGALSPPGRTIQ